MKEGKGLPNLLGDCATKDCEAAPLCRCEADFRQPKQSRPGPLAQLVEHLTFNQGVAGSNPVRPTS